MLFVRNVFQRQIVQFIFPRFCLFFFLRLKNLSKTILQKQTKTSNISDTFLCQSLYTCTCVYTCTCTCTYMCVHWIVLCTHLLAVAWLVSDGRLVVVTLMPPADHVIYQRQLFSLYLFENYHKNRNPISDWNGRVSIFVSTQYSEKLCYYCLVLCMCT